MNTTAAMRVQSSVQDAISSQSSLSRSWTVYPKTFGVLLILTLALPINIAWVSLALIYVLLCKISRILQWSSASFPAERTTAFKTILISGGKMTKSLQLARLFHRAGYRVVLCETPKYWLTGHRFSFCVDRFRLTAEPRSAAYADSLQKIVLEENVDVYVPVCSPLSSRYDSEAISALIDHCEIIHPSLQHIDLLDDKFQFASAAKRFGLKAPESFLITHPDQVLNFDFSNQTRPMILKSIEYDSIRRLDLTRLPMDDPAAMRRFVQSLPISKDRPWVMQEFIAGKEYCTHSTVVDGKIRVHVCCESSEFQINYKHIDEPEIAEWVHKFVHHLGLTGQLSFDFIRADDDGQVYAIECNPRTHSAITAFYDDSRVANAYLNPSPIIIQPRPSARPTHWVYHEIWRLFTSPFYQKQKAQRIADIVHGKDAIFDWQDPLPFLMVHHFQIPLLLIRCLLSGKEWVRIDFNIGKLVQLGGD